jgi:hypothetical protein
MNEISSKKWVVGDRFQSKWDKSAICTLIKIRDGGKKPYTIEWDNKRKVHCDESWFDGMKFLEETECNSHNLTSAQELAQDFVMQVCNSDLNLQQSQKLTNTVQVSSNCDIPTYTTMAMCEIYQDLQNAELGIICTQEDSTLLQLPHPAPHSQQKGNDLEQQTKETVSPPSLKSSENCNLDSQQSKTSPACSAAHINQDMSMATSGMFFNTFPQAGMMRNGLLSEAATLPAPTLESEYCWLRSPGALSLSGKGRPPGQTKQEAELKKLGLINKGEVLNPAILCQWYEIPDSWLDPLECRAATELLEECDRQQEIFSILESQGSPYNESSTSTPCVENQPSLTRANAKAGTYIIDKSESLGIIKQNLGFGFVVDWFSSEFTYNWERDDQMIAGLAIALQHLVEKFLEDNHPQLCTRCLKVVDREYTCDKCPPMQCTQQTQDVHCPSCESPLIKLDDSVSDVGASGCGVCGWTPENFLEETEPQPEVVQKPKGRQRKGCLYRYIENKKLKNGTIASYPRVIGDRNHDNPTHWRWGFNWEEKVDGEWKGRSIGSVPLGAIALIQSMQNEGVSLEEIIDFIRRAKAKK